MKTKLLLIVTLLSFSVNGLAQNSAFSEGGKGYGARVEQLKKLAPQYLKKAYVPGMSMAVIKNGEIFWTGSFGVKSSKTGEAVTDDTIFEAASLSKPVVAYAVLKLVDAGKFDLDVPLNRYLGNNYDVGDDPRLNQITARKVLSHTSGFPNWRPRRSKTLKINFTPGEKFSYSGEGFVYLAKIVEKLTGKDLNTFIRETVLKPLKMNKSSFDWEPEFFKAKGFIHDGFGTPRGQNAERGVNAAASLHTTASDYARFVAAVLKGKGLKKSTRNLMVTPVVSVDSKESPNVSWGLGWGLEKTPEGRTFFHWGDNGFSKAYVVANDKTKDAVMFFTNGSNGLSFLSEILEYGIGGSHPSVKWIGYGRYDSPTAKLQNAIVEQGAEAALKNYRKMRKESKKNAISERGMNRLGYTFMRAKRTADAILIFKQNTSDFPESGNVWDSLAEAYAKNGDKELAIKHYKKAFKLDPKNKNAEEQIKQLSGN